MKRILQIIPYFGKWPEWFNLYLYSCSKNEMVDFLFYTDCEIPSSHYKNVKFISMSYENYCKIVGEGLKIDFHPKSSYKLTDLKPFLGYVHQDELKSYDFWSFGDIDLCYGDLSDLLSEKNLEKFDLITTHCYHIAGHFTIIRNNSYFRELCFKISDWKDKLTSDTHFALDEGEWSDLAFPGLKRIRSLWTHIVKRLHVSDFFTFMNKMNSFCSKDKLFYEFNTSPAPQIGEVWKYNTSTGDILSPDGSKLPYLHFLFFKKTPWFETENYWRDRYYQIGEHITSYKTIEISLEGVKGY